MLKPAWIDRGTRPKSSIFSVMGQNPLPVIQSESHLTRYKLRVYVREVFAN